MGWVTGIAKQIGQEAADDSVDAKFDPAQSASRKLLAAVPLLAAPSGAIMMAGEADAQEAEGDAPPAPPPDPFAGKGWVKDKPNPGYDRFRATLTPGMETAPEIVSGMEIHRYRTAPSASAVWGAAFRLENVIGSVIAREEGVKPFGDAIPRFNPDFDPLSKENLEGYEAFSDRFISVYDEDESEALKRQIDREAEDRDTLARGGWSGIVAQFVAGTVDPTIFLPIGGTIKKGESLLTIGAKSALGAGGGALVSEAILQGSQETRSFEESALAVGGATFLGGLLGPGSYAALRGFTGKPIAGFDSGEFDALATRIEQEMVYDPDGDLNAPDPVLTARIQNDLKALDLYDDNQLAAQTTALEAMVSTLARRTGQDPSAFYEQAGPRLVKGGDEAGANLLAQSGDAIASDTGLYSPALMAARALPQRRMKVSEAIGRIEKGRGLESATRIKKEVEELNLREAFADREFVTPKEIEDYIELNRVVLGAVREQFDPRGGERPANLAEMPPQERAALVLTDKSVKKRVLNDLQSITVTRNDGSEASAVLRDGAWIVQTRKGWQDEYSAPEKINLPGEWTPTQRSAVEAELGQKIYQFDPDGFSKSLRGKLPKSAAASPLRMEPGQFDLDDAAVHGEISITLPERLRGMLSGETHSGVEGEAINILWSIRKNDQGKRTLFIRQLQSDEAKTAVKTKTDRVETAEPTAPIVSNTSTWVTAGMRAVLVEAARRKITSVAFPDGKTSAFIQGNDFASDFYNTTVSNTADKVSRQIGATSRTGTVLDGDGNEFGAKIIDLTPDVSGKLRREGLPLYQDQRGAFNPATRELHLFEAKDASTLMHEASHWYLNALFSMRGNNFVEKQLDDILTWNKADIAEIYDDAGNLTLRGVELQEAFAETFETYLQTGKAPVPRLQAVFDKFREWLTAIYKTLDPRQRANLTPEIKEVFDRMLAMEPGAMERADMAAMRGELPSGNLSAAMTKPLTLDDYAIAPSLGTADVSTALRMNPLLRLSATESPKARDIANRLMENGMYLNRNKEGLASPVSVETALTEYRGWHAAAVDASRKAYKAHRKAKGGLSEGQFYEELGRTLRRGDQSDVPGVADAAKAFRTALDKTKSEAIKVGLFPEDVATTTAPSYFHRMWNRNRLIRQPDNFKQMTRAYLGEQMDKLKARAANIEADAAKTGAKLSKEDADLVKQAQDLLKLEADEGGLDAYVKDSADHIYDTLMGHDAREMPLDITAGPRGPLKERTFNIPDLFEAGGIRVEDFLVDDAREVMDRYMRVISADIELTREFGSPDMKGAVDDIKAEYDELIENLPGRETGTAAYEAAAKRLRNQANEAIKDIQGVRDVIRGTYGAPVYEDMWRRGAAIVRSWNYVTMLGGMTVSALPDVANKVLANGFLGVTRDLLVPLISDLKGVKMAAREARALGVAVEQTLATRIATMADIGDIYGRGTGFERSVGAMANHFTKWTGMRLWNDVMKQADYLMGANRAGRIIERPDKADANAKAWLANLGIGEADYSRIRKMLKAHGEKRDSVFLTNAHLWEDAEARRLWIGAMGKNANIQTVTPGAGDKLLVMNGDLGKTIGQFKTFVFGANQRVTIRGAQQARMGQARVASFVMTGAALGALVYFLKSKGSGRDVSDDPAVWAREAVDRSGMISVFMEAFNTAEKVSGKTFVGESPSSRYASRGAFASLLGPSVGRGEDAVNFIQRALDGELQDRDIHALRKLLPYNNLFWLRTILDDLEDVAVDATNAEETALSETRERVFIPE